MPVIRIEVPEGTPQEPKRRIRDGINQAVIYTPDQFASVACRTFMVRVKAVLDEGVRFALVDRLPVESLTNEEGRILFWLLSSLIARPVAQKRYGHLPNGMIADVVDTGAKPTPGSGVRPDQTNVELIYRSSSTTARSATAARSSRTTRRRNSVGT